MSALAAEALWSPADGTSSYVRRLRSPGWLVYHRSDCRHVAGREDVVEVDVQEVRQALAISPTFVEYEGRKVYLYPCRQCLRRDRLQKWPPETAR